MNARVREGRKNLATNSRDISALLTLHLLLPPMKLSSAGNKQ
jgi:hypothetical protein